MWWKKKRQERYDAAFLDGYRAAKEEDVAHLEQAVETGAILAYRSCAEALKEAARQNSPDAIAEVCKKIAKYANLP
jgi:predicted O-methyltransferase YrrM